MAEQDVQAPKRVGRPPKAPEDRLVMITFRGTAEMRDKIAAAGPDQLRALLNRWKPKADNTSDKSVN